MISSFGCSTTAKQQQSLAEPGIDCTWHVLLPDSRDNPRKGLVAHTNIKGTLHLHHTLAWWQYEVTCASSSTQPGSMTAPEQTGANALIPHNTTAWTAKPVECNATNRLKLGTCSSCTMPKFTPQNIQNSAAGWICKAAFSGPGTMMQHTTPAPATAGSMGTALWTFPHRDMQPQVGSHSAGQKFEQGMHITPCQSQHGHPTP